MNRPGSRARRKCQLTIVRSRGRQYARNANPLSLVRLRAARKKLGHRPSRDAARDRAVAAMLASTIERIGRISIVPFKPIQRRSFVRQNSRSRIARADKLSSRSQDLASFRQRIIDPKSDFAQFRIMAERGIRLYGLHPPREDVAESVGCIPLSKGYRANLNIGRSAVPSGDPPRNRATRSPTCDPFCSLLRSTVLTDPPIIFFFSTLLRDTVFFTRYFDESGNEDVSNAVFQGD